MRARVATGAVEDLQGDIVVGGGSGLDKGGAVILEGRRRSPTRVPYHLYNIIKAGSCVMALSAARVRGDHGIADDDHVVAAGGGRVRGGDDALVRPEPGDHLELREGATK